MVEIHSRSLSDFWVGRSPAGNMNNGNNDQEGNGPM